MNSPSQLTMLKLAGFFEDRRKVRPLRPAGSSYPLLIANEGKSQNNRDGFGSYLKRDISTPDLRSSFLHSQCRLNAEKDMSRTVGHNKASNFGVNAGRDLWAKRPNAGSSRTKFNRQRTVRIERRVQRDRIRKALKTGQ